LTKVSESAAAAAAIIFLMGAAAPVHIDPFELIVGSRIESVISEMTERGMILHTRGSLHVARSTAAIPRLFERQDLVLVEDIGGRLSAVHVHIIPEWSASGPEILRLFEDVRAHLIGRLGRPSWERREGQARGDGILEAFGNGELTHVTQWDSPGRSIRTGVPRRVDGRVLVEIRITRERQARNEMFWSAE
jgi:hypothetical protein